MSREIDIDRRSDGERRSRAIEAAVATIATRQHGVVSRLQLREVGLSDDEIDGWIRAKRLHPLHRGVYAVGHRRVSREGRYLAAVLFAGDGAVLSHCAAADVWELRATKERRIDVTVPSDRRGDRGVGIRRHAIEPTDITTRQGIRTTTPLRTLLDLAAAIPQRELERAVRQAVYHHLTSTTLLAEAVESHPGRRGSKAMRQTLIHLGEAPGVTRSELEARFLRFLRKHRLPLPELNQELKISGRRIEADCLWRERRVVVELDGRDAHDSTPAFEADRARDAALVAAHWRVVRVTNTRIRIDGARLAAQLRALLA